MDASAAEQVPLSPGGDKAGIALGFDTYICRGRPGSTNDYSPIAKLSEKLEQAPAQGFYPWKNSDGSYCEFPKEFADYVVGLGATPIITWQASQADSQNHVERPQAEWTCLEIASGRDDDYIRQWATAVRAYPHVVYVRLMHEFNATPYPWAYAVDQVKNAPEKYIAAFRHLVGIFHEARVSNVQFIWCFGCGSQKPPPETWFPGDDYVDWIGLDGYNHGFTKDGKTIYVSGFDGHLYAVPIEGGQSRRVSQDQAPQRQFKYYLHGVSLDSKHFAFVMYPEASQ